MTFHSPTSFEKNEWNQTTKKYVFETIRMETKDFGKPQDVGSDCVSQQKFRFPFQPYGVQTQFMNTLFDILTKGNIGIVESPTGTVR